MVVYFSGTGNSRYCARMIAQKLGDEIIDASGYIKNGKTAELEAFDKLIFVSPVYGWQMPHIFSDFIRRCPVSPEVDVYFVLTCGSDIGNAGEYLEILCREKNMCFCGVLEVVMPENYIAMFPVPNESKSQKIIAAAHPVLERGINCILENRPFPKHNAGIFGNTKSGLVNNIFCRYFIKSDPFYVDNKCIGCGKCAELCPLNNIVLKGSKPVWGKNCTHCMSCICYCPAEAIEYGRRSVGKRRYRCSEYPLNK